MTFYSKQLTWWGRLALSGPSVLIVLGNDYLNAISNLFTRPQREGGGVKTTTAGRSWGQRWRVGIPQRAERGGRFSCDNKIKERWNGPSPQMAAAASLSCFQLSPRPLRTQIMQHSASRCHTSIPCSQWLSESLGCCSLPFFHGPPRANML